MPARRACCPPDIAARFDPALHALVAHKVSWPEAVRVFGVTDVPSGFATSFDFGRLYVFAADAAGAGGAAFALAYAAFLVVKTWHWYAVQRQDRDERPECVVLTRRYVNGLVLSVVVMLVSAVLPAEPRLIA